ncbi:MAG: hypothetical protein II374_05760 [Lachnospiraceae bacterium]|nr:hypothetical protein [Lachnospiraceae bacterium]MBQ2320833.1 hypothetical protein [Lachnospiraceae bacterium]
MLKKKIIALIMVFALMSGSVVYTEADAASKPGRATVKVEKRAKNTITLKIKKPRGTGYQVFVKTSKKGKFTQVGAGRVDNAKISIFKIKKVKKDKKYYVKVRTFKTSGFMITKGSYSKTVKIDKYKIKKKPQNKPTPEEIIEPDTSVVTEAAIGAEGISDSSDETETQVTVTDSDYSND